MGRLVLGDLIVAIDGETIRNLDDLFRSLDTHQVGDTLILTVVRDERRTDVQINLQAIDYALTRAFGRRQFWAIL